MYVGAPTALLPKFLSSLNLEKPDLYNRICLPVCYRVISCVSTCVLAFFLHLHWVPLGLVDDVKESDREALLLCESVFRGSHIRTLSIYCAYVYT